MVLAEKDIELLKLICWCKNIPAQSESYKVIFTNFDTELFIYHGLISKSKDGSMLRAKPSAYRILQQAGYRFQQDIKTQTDISVVERRMISAQILFAFYRASIDVFMETIDETTTNVFLASFAARRGHPNNPFGSTKFYGIYASPQTIYLVLYPDYDGVYFKKELKMFNGLAEQIRVQNRAIIFIGKSTTQIGEIVFNPKLNNRSNKKLKTDTFSKVFDETSLPVHFIPIGDAGSQVLKVLQVQNYRETIAREIMRSKYTPPYAWLPDTDTIHYNEKGYLKLCLSSSTRCNRNH